jgi:hypothetical protein
MPDPHVLAPDRAPTPFTADEIRSRCPEGKTIRVRIEVAGQAPFERVTRYADVGDSGATLIKSRLAPDGSPDGDPESDRVTWRDLQSHASFPAAATTIEPERIETALGELDCLRYTVRDGADEDVFWFATDLPGMPVRYVTSSDGRAVMSVSVMEISVG